MASINYPGAADVAVTIAACLDAVHVCAERRDVVMKNSLCPVSMLLEACRLASAAGPEEEAVLMQCIRRLCSQAEIARRDTYLANLLGKLTTYRDMH
jgi:hypothetical protein